MTTGARQLLAFTFGSDSTFEGQLVGALERIESGGSVRVLDGLFVARAPESGELSAIALSDSPPSRMTSRLLGFRLDAKDRRAATQQALDGQAGEAVRSLAARLTPGSAIAAVLLEHTWADALADAVARVGGTEVASDFVDGSNISDLMPRLVAAAEQAAGARPATA
jgi:hypothetical protein